MTITAVAKNVSKFRKRTEILSNIKCSKTRRGTALHLCIHCYFTILGSFPGWEVPWNKAMTMFIPSQLALFPVYNQSSNTNMWNRKKLPINMIIEYSCRKRRNNYYSVQHLRKHLSFPCWLTLLSTDPIHCNAFGTVLAMTTCIARPGTLCDHLYCSLEYITLTPSSLGWVPVVFLCVYILAHTTLASVNHSIGLLSDDNNKQWSFSTRPSYNRIGINRAPQ